MSIIGLRALTLKNFKAYKAEQTITFAPVTLLFGPNSGGKSSIFDALTYLNDIFSGKIYRGEGDSRARFLSLVHAGDPALDIELSVTLQQSVKENTGQSVRHTVVVGMNEALRIPVVKKYTVSLDEIWAMEWCFMAKGSNEYAWIESRDSNLSIPYESGHYYQVKLNPEHPLLATENLWKRVDPFYGAPEKFETVFGGEYLKDYTKICNPSCLMPTSLGIHGNKGFCWNGLPGENLLSEFRKLFDEHLDEHLSHLFREEKQRVKLAFLNSIRNNSSEAEVAVSFPLPDNQVFTAWYARAVEAAENIKSQLKGLIPASLSVLHLGPLREITEGQARNSLNDENGLSIRDIGNTEAIYRGVAAWNWFQTLARFPEFEKDASLSSSSLAQLDFPEPEQSLEWMLETINRWLHDDLKIDYELRFQSEWRLDAEYLRNWLNKQQDSVPVSELLEYITHSELLSRVELWDSKRNIRAHPRQIGAGIAQVLPVLMMLSIHDLDRLKEISSLTDPIAQQMARHFESIALLIEQPELHLHPAQQTRLGDIFIEGKGGRDCYAPLLIETHSEHLLLRLLRRIRETTQNLHPKEELALYPEELSVNYIHQPRGVVTIKQLRVDEDGDFIDDWPGGFFEESYHEKFAGR